MNMLTRTFKRVKSPKWDNAEHTSFTAYVIFQEIDHMGYLPFTASLADNTEHGRDIFNRGLAGEFGPIKEYA